ncbi:MAG: hypothetical protein ABWY06_12780 [Pseudomonas sp.]|uniref:hypothetical protein n=1 Tax=Pseudomonas sp. TaxID=306 RepID=UPI0033920543
MSLIPRCGRFPLSADVCIRQVRLLLLPLLLLASACDHRPAANTPEYRQAHGLVEGRDNRIVVGATRFRIPAALPVEVYTGGPIQPGRADTLTLYLDFPGRLEQPADLGILSPSTVRVEIKDIPGGEEQLTPLSRQDARWQRVFDRPDLGLTEFHDLQFDGGWGYISYQSLAPDARTPLGAPIQLACSGFPVGTVHQCRGEFRMPAGPYVWYFISVDLLPHWRDVQRGIVETTEQLTKD